MAKARSVEMISKQKICIFKMKVSRKTRKTCVCLLRARVCLRARKCSFVKARECALSRVCACSRAPTGRAAAVSVDRRPRGGRRSDGCCRFSLPPILHLFPLLPLSLLPSFLPLSLSGSLARTLAHLALARSSFPLSYPSSYSRILDLLLQPHQKHSPFPLLSPFPVSFPYLRSSPLRLSIY
jgi:hypothetical protein